MASITNCRGSGNQTRGAGVYTHMRYWAFFLAKIALAAAVYAGIWIVMESLLPEPTTFRDVQMRRFGQDLTWTTAIFVLFLAVAGTIGLIIWDQRYRCRTCFCGAIPWY